MSQEETVYLETLKAKMDSKLNQFFGPLTGFFCCNFVSIIYINYNLLIVGFIYKEQLSVGSLQMLGRKGDNLVSDARFCNSGWKGVLQLIEF